MLAVTSGVAVSFSILPWDARRARETHRMTVLAIIPARAGSKSLPHKNIRSFRGTPLLALAVQQARASRLVDRVLVSTDSEEYAAIARAHGAEVPFLRPAEFAGDLSTDLEVFEHALGWWRAHEPALPELLVHLRPTYPTRTPQEIDGAIELLRAHPQWDSVRSVSPAPESPLKMWWLREDGTMAQVADAGIRESHSMPRQALPTAYLQNACVDVLRPRAVLEQRSMTGRAVGAFVMAHHHDIDTAAHLDAAAASVAEHAPASKPGSPHAGVLCLDMDGVIATIAPENDYARAQPQQDVIDAVNALHDSGHRIVVFTARGSATGIDWAPVTREQLRAWGVRHHELRFGKPAADLYVDDRAARVDELLRMARRARAAGSATSPENTHAR